MTYDELPVLMRHIQCTYTLLLITALFCVVAASIRMRRGMVSYIVSGALVVVTYFLYEIFTALMLSGQGFTDRENKIAPFHHVPEWMWIASLVFLTLLGALLAADLIYYGKGRLSSHSVKFATDDLPTGLCIYDKSGRILLMNETMAKIGTELTGEYVLIGPQILSRINPGGTPLRMSDGSVYTFGLETANIGGAELFEITAENITEEYLLTERLHKVDEELVRQQQRLKELNVLITEMTIQKEILAAKTSIHDRFGSTLIATKRFMRGDSENTREEITDIWLRCLDLFRSAAEPEQKNVYEKVFTVAEYVGVDIEVTGALPEEKTKADIIFTALIECLTNTFRHAHGDRIILECKESAGHTAYILTNNGEPPKAEIRETGGLKNLRQAAENAGWQMDIQSKPEFMLTLKAPADTEMITDDL